MLERVECHRQTQARIARQQALQQWIAAQVPGDGGGVAVQVEHAPDARRQLWGEIAGCRAQFEFQGALRWPQAKPAAAFAEAETAAVAVVGQVLDPGQAAQREMSLELLPAPGLEIIKAHGLAGINHMERLWSWCDDSFLAPCRLCKTDFQICPTWFDLSSKPS
ncbi:hypothetical protein D9M73_201990 [compost metagenome]